MSSSITFFVKQLIKKAADLCHHIQEAVTSGSICQSKVKHLALAEAEYGDSSLSQYGVKLGKYGHIPKHLFFSKL